MNLAENEASTSRSQQPRQPSSSDSGLGTTPGRKIPPQNPFILPVPSTCEFCYAKIFRNEPPGICCSRGDICLPTISIPDDLRSLFLSNNQMSQNFRQYILLYNNSFAFTSLGVKKDHEYTHRNRGIYTFRVQGQVYHFINEILPTQERPRYIQLYFYDTDLELYHRSEISRNLQQDVTALLMRVMEVNPYALFFRSLRDCNINDSSRIVIRCDPTQDQRTHNAPTASQIAAIWVEDNNSTAPLTHDIVVYASSGESYHIRHYYGCYDPLQYPILFIYGETGWHRAIYRIRTCRARRRMCSTFPINDVLVQSVDDLIDMEEQVATSSESEKKVSCREYYCYRLQIRVGDQSVLLRSGRLLQQFVVDMYIKIETTRLDFFRLNQKSIRAELYQGIVDSFNAGEIRPSNIGHRLILPATFLGCERDMRCRYLNSMSLVQRFGKPDIFLTMTCNPRWPEIARELLPFEEAQNRPDLVTRVFRAKLIEVKKEIVEKKLFGKVAAYIYVIEFQKRGLPHVHFLIILESENKIRAPDQYDNLVSAEIPDPSENAHLYAATLRHMIHGPCGINFPNSPCMKNSRCKNRYPKEYADVTTNGRNSYPIYRRRRNGLTATVRGAEVDNSWVVPHNPFLLAKYDCHINVEVCSTVKAVKYLYKYVYKGHDRVSFAVDDENSQHVVDEISSYQNARWVSPPEAAWRIFRFCLNDIYPNVVVLQVHLPNMQPITFRPNERIEEIAEDENRKKTILTAFFETNSRDSFARTLLYQQFPEHYVWIIEKKKKYWSLRQKGTAIGRLVYANPSEGERYYLRLLLINVRGPRSFEDLLTVDGFLCSSFRDSAYRRGLLEDDESIEKCLDEAAHFQLPYVLRRLFSTLLIFCQPQSPRDLFDRFFKVLSEDFELAFPKQPYKVLQMTLRNINSILESMGRGLDSFDFRGLRLDVLGTEERRMKEVEEELNIPITSEEINDVHLLNSEQKLAYDIIYDRVMQENVGAFFLDGPGGTGKTFLYSTLLANLRSKGIIALAVASSGIAASNIAGGRTANSRFKIPLDIEQNQSSQISKQSGLGELIRRCRLIIWDEASMARRQAIEHFDRTMRDVCSNELAFGGKVVVFGGDFRQVLPVVPKCSLTEAIDSSFVMSPLWPMLEKLHLTLNMRAIHDPTFSDFVLNVGNGCEPYENGRDVKLPRSVALTEKEDCSLMNQLIESIYPDIHLINLNPLLTTKKAILTPRNEDTEAINSICVSKQRGNTFEYKSFDEATDVTTEQYPIEFLNTLHPNGLPPHHLVLKLNSPVILLRNLDPTSGLCNGTKLICKKFTRNVIDAEIATGHHKGERVFIPRIPLQPSSADKFPFSFRRKQFPIKLSFAMTINKAQGQTLDKVGIYLPRPVFSHGQLYVALSRAKKGSDVKVAVNPLDSSDDSWRKTKNIVCYEVLRSVGIM